MDLTLAINAGTVWYPKYTFRSTLAQMRVADGRKWGAATQSGRGCNSVSQSIAVNCAGRSGRGYGELSSRI